MAEALKVLVLGGGPDREREVSLRSAAAVAAALRQAGHEVSVADVSPDDAAALDRCRADAVFPALHGRFGEGGPLQRMLEMRKLRYVGSRPQPSAVAMDKCASKQVAETSGVPTPPYQLLGPLTPLNLPPPLVLKPLTEGSSFGVEICRDDQQLAEARKRLHAHFAFVLAERFIPGRELTAGIVGDELLPVIEIRPAAGFYDYQAKYDRDDTSYNFEIDLPPEALNQVRAHARTMFERIGCRHLARVDFLVDQQNNPWFIEINTIPGFTDHSLVPMAAAKAGMDMPALCDRLVRLALKS